MTNTTNDQTQVQKLLRSLEIGEKELEKWEGAYKNSVTLVWLVQNWGAIDCPKTKKVLGLQMLKILDKNKVLSDEFAMCVLDKVGTPTYMVEDQREVETIAMYLSTHHSLACRVSAMKALLRIVRYASAPTLPKTLVDVREEILILSNHPNTSAAQFANSLLAIAA